MFLLLACSESGPPPIPAEPVGLDNLDGPTGAMGLPLPPTVPKPPPNTTVCAGWAESVVVPAKFAIVECVAGRVAMSGRGDLLETCAEVQAGLRRAGWADSPRGTFRYALARGDQEAELMCVETPGGVIVTVSGE